MTHDRVALLLAQMDYTFGQGGWFAAMHKALEGLTAAEAAWSPAPGTNTIWQMLNHLTFWKEIVAGRLGGAPLSGGRVANDHTFGAPGIPDDEAGWKAAVERFFTAQQALRDAINRLDDSALDEPLPGERTPLQDLLSGLSAHDVYHLGQIVLLRKLKGSWNGSL